MTHDADVWNEAISSWFFNDAAAGQLVYLSMDDQELERLANHSRLADQQHARASFLAAMRLASAPTDPFGYLVWRTKSWQRLPQPRPAPPFVAVLALTALVADDAKA